MRNLLRSTTLLIMVITAIIIASTQLACNPSKEKDTIDVVPDNASITIGNNQQFQAIGIDSDDRSVDVTEQVTWTSSDSSIAVIDASGLAQGQSEGQTTITATKVSPVRSKEVIEITVTKGTQNDQSTTFFYESLPFRRHPLAQQREQFLRLGYSVVEKGEPRGAVSASHGDLGDDLVRREHPGPNARIDRRGPRPAFLQLHPVLQLQGAGGVIHRAYEVQITLLAPELPVLSHQVAVHAPVAEHRG